MKCGVRKEDEKTGNKNWNKFLESKSSGSVSYLPHDNAKAAYAKYQAIAAFNAKKAFVMMDAEVNVYNNNVIFNYTNKQDKIWVNAYRDAVKEMDLSPEAQATLAVYAALVQYGIENIFDVAMVTRNGKKTYAYRHRETGDLLYTIGDAKAYTKREGRRSREKNSQGEAVKVKVNKNKSGGKKPVGYSEISNGTLKEVGKSFKQDKIIKDVKSTMSKIGKKKMSSLK